MAKNYIQFDPATGYPAGSSVYYECTECGELLPSLPAYAVACKCRNIVVDADAGRVSVRKPEMFRAFESDATDNVGKS